jgi:hypothetical protein
METKRKKYIDKIITVFVLKTAGVTQIVEDEVIQIGTDRFKSVKFRYTYYCKSQFIYIKRGINSYQLQE